MQLNANSPKFLLAVLILAGLSLVYTITATVPANQPTDQAPVLTTVAPRTQVAQVASSCTVGDLTCGLVGWWKLDEGSGTTASDSSGSGNTGTLTGSALPTWTAGKIGVALSFNGTNQYVTVNDSSSLAFGTGGFTVSFWIDPTTDSQPTNNSLIWKMYPSLSNGWYIALSPTGKIYPYYRSDAPHYSYQFYSNATIPANVWTHVAVVTDRSAGLIRIYVNGAPDATYNIAGWGSFDTSSALLMGSLFSGSLDDVRIYDRTLSASEVSSLYQAGTNTTTAPQASAPIISNIATSNISPSGAAISWTTDTAASSEILYGLASTYGSNTTADNTQVTSHSQTLSGLLANTTYHYAVVSTDSVGTTQSADQTFTTAQAVQSPSGTTYDLNWYFNGPGNGTVACSLGGGAEQVCPKTFSANTVVAMTEYPGTNSSFTGWGGDCWGPALNASGNICTLTMNGPHTFSASFAQNTAAASSRVFYIATDGSDSNSGTSKSSPWLHAPGMADCTGACATTVPSPGDSFILKGGDVWHVGNGSLPSSIGGSWKWSWGGDAAAGLYLGVDHSWYDASTCGSTWCAPIFDGDNPLSKTPVASCAYPAGDPFLSAAGTTYLTIDGLEFRGMCQQGVPAYGQATYLVWGSAAATGMSHDVTENIYVHGWTHVPYACTLVNGTETGNCMGADGSLSFGDGNTLAHYRCDGSDSDPSLACTYGSLYDVHDSFFNNVSQGILGSGFHTVHDNLIENVPPGLDGVAHTNGFELLNEYPGTNFVYNNVVRNVTAGVTGWSCPNA
ncbi:MAG: hypothetical protein KGI66_03440, partial [Patescibacteria group bacterium]|nr:hypothetical protein [Patescibacteria group bacterium]